MKRNTFNLSNDQLLTGKIGMLYPIGLHEVLPNDTFRGSSNVLARLAPMAAPVYHNMTLRVHHFYVSQKNIWDYWNEWNNNPDNGVEGGDPSKTFDWKKFITGDKTIQGQKYPPHGTFAPSNYPPGDLYDYFGLPKKGTTGRNIDVNKAPFIAYNMIWQQYYADQDFQLDGSLYPGWANPNSTSIQHINWEKDYFTTARPWPTLDGDAMSIPIIGADGEAKLVRQDGLSLGPGETKATIGGAFHDNTNAPIHFELDITEFRTALALNRWGELQAKYGHRYVEYMRYYLQSQMPQDQDKPVYLGGGSAPLNISEVLQTAPETSETSPTEYGVGDMYGHGISSFRSNEFMSTFDEHGYVMSLLSVRPKAVYTTGIERHFLKGDRHDYYDPLLADIGMQPIYNAEVFASGDTQAADAVWPDLRGVDGDTWGFQNRYDEYRTKRSIVAGEFRDLLNYWHLGREFDALPDLNAYFLRVDPDEVDRIFNIQDKDHLWINVHNKFKAKRIVKRPSLGRTI